jgi:hypothetical protein
MKDVVSIKPELRAFSNIAKVAFLEREMLKHPQVSIRTKHYFSDGIYAREVLIPAGVMVTGKLHKYRQLNIVSQGDISVLLADGVKRIRAPYTVVSPSGTKRIAFAHADTVWTTILQTDSTDLDEIEDHFIAKDEADYLEFCRTLQIGK